MTPQEFAKLLEYIKANNSWGENMYEICCQRNRRAIKYVDATFDSRDGTVWYLTFRSQTHGEDKKFRIEKQEDIKSVYDWLDEVV